MPDTDRSLAVFIDFENLALGFQNRRDRFDIARVLERLVEKRERFDAVVLDVMLPGKSGFDVAALLREKKNYVPILMLTARGRAEDVLQGFASGADDYLPKPFELAILIARLESLLRRSPARMAVATSWRMASSWAGVGAPAASPITFTRAWAAL